jgi:hypothetical protein
MAQFLGPESYIQLGAEWLHNRHNPLFKMAQKLGLFPNSKVKSDDFETTMRFIDENGRDVPSRLRKDYMDIEEKIYAMMDKGSFSGYKSSSYGDLCDDLFEKLIQRRKFKYTEDDVKILMAMHKASR